MDGDWTLPANDLDGAGSASCAQIDERMSELLAGDLPDSLRGGLELHVRGCARCAAEVAASKELVARLRALPTTARPTAVWRSIELALEREPARRPYAFALKFAALAAAGIVVAATLVLRNDALVALVEARLPDRLRDSLLGGALRGCLLPTLFTLFGAIASLLALPLLAGRSHAPLLVPVAESESAS
jgi:anti-sigma factor RsiW